MEADGEVAGIAAPGISIYTSLGSCFLLSILYVSR